MTPLAAIAITFAVLGLLLAVLRAAGPARQRSNELCVLATTNLGGRQSLCVVQAGKKRLLIANGGGQVSKIAELDPADWPKKTSCTHAHMLSWIHLRIPQRNT